MTMKEKLAVRRMSRMFLRIKNSAPRIVRPIQP